MENEYVNIIKEEEEKEIIIEKENIEMSDATLEELTVLPSSEQQIITPTQPKTYYNKIIVEPITTENIEVISSVEDKIVTPTTGKFINEVTVKGDTNLVSENIKEGVNILGVDGSLNTKYSPKYISFYIYSGDELDYEVSNLDTSKITNMSNMFYNCTRLTNLDLSNFDTTNVTDMYMMFNRNISLTSVNVSSFNTNNVTNMNNMFNLCEKLTKIDISSFTSEKLTLNASMFSGCSKLTTLIINNPNLFKMTKTNMLRDTPIEKGTGYVYVPDDMVETYKSATNWSVYANQIKGMSELPEEV